MNYVTKKTMIISTVVLAVLTMWSPVADAALKGYWKLDVQDSPGAGQTPDETGTFPGNYFGAFLPGKEGNALYCNGTPSTDYVRIINTGGGLALGGNNFTLAMFIKFSSDPVDAGWEMIMHATNVVSGGGNSWNLMHQDNANGTRRLFIYADQGTTELGTYTFVTDQWYHLAVVRNGSSISSYIDAVYLATGNAPGIAYSDLDKDIFLGRNQHYFFNGNTWPFLEGALDEVRIYNEALSESQIQEISGCCVNYLRADLNEDSYVDVSDLAIFAQDWLNSDCAIWTPGDVTLSKRGTAAAGNPIFSSYDLIFEGSRWDSGATEAVDVHSHFQFSPANLNEPSFSGPTLHISNLDNFVIEDGLGLDAVKFVSGRSGPPTNEHWHEAYFTTDGFTYLVNVVNANNDGEAGIRFFKGDQSNPWTLFVPSLTGWKFGIVREDLFNALVFDDDGRTMVGKLPPADFGPAEGRFHVRGMVNEVQTIVEASSSQSANIFEVTNWGRASKHLVVTAAGRVGIGTANPQGKLDVNGSIYQRGNEIHGDVAEEFPYNGQLEAGDIAVIDVNDSVKIKRSEKPYELQIAGVISTSPAFQISPQSGESTVPLALSGRVPVKVTNENGPIEAGDLLTSSSTSGHAMKFKLLEAREGMSGEEIVELINENDRRRNSIIGKALESFDGDTGKIIVLLF